MEKSLENPFDIHAVAAYGCWREQKIDAAEAVRGQLFVSVEDPIRPSQTQRAALAERIRGANMAVLDGPAGLADRDTLASLGLMLGLGAPTPNPEADADAISALTVVQDDSPRRRYIPYTNRALNWHTDGYYHPVGRPIRAVILYCVHAAARGGINHVLDPEMAYLALRDRNPDLIAALMHPEALTIPGEQAPGRPPRPACTGPVFSVDADGRLNMRYTRRARNAFWRDDPALTKARSILEHEILDGDNPYRETLSLTAGQALIGNNVLHDRSAFEDGPEGTPRRLVLRARYEGRIDETILTRPF